MLQLNVECPASISSNVGLLCLSIFYRCVSLWLVMECWCSFFKGNELSIFTNQNVQFFFFIHMLENSFWVPKDIGRSSYMVIVCCFGWKVTVWTAKHGFMLMGTVFKLHIIWMALGRSVIERDINMLEFLQKHECRL